MPSRDGDVSDSNPLGPVTFTIIVKRKSIFIYLAISNTIDLSTLNNQQTQVTKKKNIFQCFHLFPKSKPTESTLLNL